METTAEYRVLILAPRGRDARLASAILAGVGLTCQICPDLADMVRTATAGAGVALVAEEALELDHDGRVLLRWVKAQPPWSDLPFVVLTWPGGDLAQGGRTPAWLSDIGSAVLLERPIGAVALASTVQAALRARRKQYEVRAYLAERELASARLTALNASLETRVRDRTAELQAAYGRLAEETDERKQSELRLAQAQRMEALGKLAGGIAHDFNNVLQAVVGGLSLIQRRSGDAEAVRRLARMAEDAAHRGASITGRLLAFARQGALRAEPVAPRLLLQGLREMLGHTLGVGITMRIAADQGLPDLLADKGQLETVLVNLAVNARDAMPEGGTLLLAVESEAVPNGRPHPAGLVPGDYLRLSVLDTGTGMTADTLARASEPSFTTKPLGQGTGLGLAMARGFADQSGGGLTIESVHEQGTTVSLWFPQTSGISSEHLTLPENDAVSATNSAQVLVVDDDVIMWQVLVDQIEELGYRVVQAGDGLEALAELDGGTEVALLISDFAMPGMDGVTLIQEARRRFPGLPALLLTGYADPSMGVAVGDSERGPTALLRKPVSAAELAKCAAALIAHIVE